MSWETAFDEVQTDFEEFKAREDVEGMHAKWCRAATDFLKVITKTATNKTFSNAEDRALKPTFELRTVAAKPNLLTYEATSNKQRRLMNYHKKLKELATQLTRQKEKTDAGAEITSQSKKQTMQLWKNLCKGADAYRDEPYTKIGITFDDQQIPQQPLIVKAIEVAWRQVELETRKADNRRRQTIADKMRGPQKWGCHCSQSIKNS